MTLLPPHIPVQLKQLKASHALRRLKSTVPGRIDFSSNDYLGLGQEIPPLEKSAFASGGSRLLSGNHPVHEAFEAYAASLFRSSHSLLFNSGYLANLAVLSTLATRHDTWLYDERVHASLKDGLRLSPAKRFSFRHNDLTDLERLLKKTQGTRFILTEGLFSMDGDFSDLKGLVDLAKTHGAFLVLDEAHSTGLCGPAGAGLAVEAGLEAEILLRVHTFGKAAGWHGAVVACPEAVRDFMVNKARPFIYTTAMPPSDCQQLHRQVERMAAADPERQRLLELRNFLQAKAATAGLRIPSGTSPIVPLLCPGNEEVKSLANGVQQAGFDVRPILAPTVLPGTERLRIVLRCTHQEQDLEGLVDALAKGLSA